MTVTIQQDRVSALIKALETLRHRTVLIGIPAEFAQRDDDDSPINNAQIGYISEFGSPKLNIPQRAHLIPGVRAYLPKAETRLKKAIIAACDSTRLTAGRPSEDIRKPQPSLKQIQSEAKRAKPLDPVLKQLNAIGVEAVVSVKKQITDGLSPALAPATLAARKLAGFPGEKPLIMSSDYLRHINFVIRKV